MGTANEEGEKWMCVQIADVHDSPVENLPRGNSILSGIGLMVNEKQPKKQSGCGKVVLTCG